MNSEFHIYEGTGQREIPPFSPNEKLNAPNLYKPSKELVNAVNVALALGQPLLLTGEPGTGKTQLAYHLAYFFNLGRPLIFNTKTTSSATDLFYQYDSLKHFQYIQNHNRELTDEEVEKRFIKYQALGEAIKRNKRTIVLIDEIDKAPRDLPNDILDSLENLEFEVPEINRVGEQRVKADTANRPIIIMTSNSEKNLPDAFLRRCAFYHIAFPDEKLLLHILTAKTNSFNEEELKLITTHFQEVRDICKRKKPATAELLYWIVILDKIKFDVQKLGLYPDLEDADKKKLLMTYSVLAKNVEDMKLLERALFK